MPIMITRTEDPGIIKKLIESSAAAIVDFSTEWCGPCQKLAKDLEAVNTKYGKQIAIKADNDVVKGRATRDGKKKIPIDEFMKLLPFYKDVDACGGIPVILFFKHGKRIDKIVLEGEAFNGLVFGAIPGLDVPASGYPSIEGIMRENGMVT